MAGFDADKMKKIKEVDLDGIVISVSTYDNGPAKVGINRYYAKQGDDGKEEIRFRKLGRLSTEEAKGIVEFLPELIEVAEAANAKGGGKKGSKKKAKKKGGKKKSRGKDK